MNLKSRCSSSLHRPASICSDGYIPFVGGAVHLFLIILQTKPLLVVGAKPNIPNAFQEFHAPFLLIGLLFWSGCDEIDNISGGASAPEVTYGSTTYEADFYQPGATSAPNIDWNGAQGTISLGSTIAGLNVNSTTGQVQWTKMLPPGTHDVEVIVNNSEGQVVVPITIQNALEGSFEGDYSGGSYFALIFVDDGTVEVEANSSTSPDEGNGTYTMEDDDTVVIDYTYTSTGEEYSVRVDLTQGSNEATLEGNWFFGYGAEGTPGGSVNVVLE